jgi:1-phosphatidylinositol-3-phosphate 5-kinase
MISVSGSSKTLMFFEGCSLQHLGCTVLLRGATNSELAKLKRVVSRIVFTQYSWRLEKSFLMDEFALPPSSPPDSFFEEPIINSCSHDRLVISCSSNPKLCLKNGSMEVSPSCENVAKDSVLHIHVSSQDNKESAKIAVINNENVRNNICDVPVTYGLPHKTGDINAKDENIKSLSKTGVLPSSNVQLSKNVQSENSSTGDKNIRICNDKVEHIIPSHSANYNKSPQSENRKNVVSDNVNCMYSSALPHENVSCVCEPIHKLKESHENDKEVQVLLNESCYDTCDASKTQAVRTGSKEKSLSEEKRMTVESVSDFSDPLHLYLNLEDEVFHAGNQSTGSGQWLSVAELPLSNRFRKALDDTILSSSPYLKVSFLFSSTNQ